MDFGELLNAYGFRTMFNPEFLMVVSIAALFYLHFARDRIDRTGVFTLITGLFCFYLTLGGPLNLLGQLWFSFHMIQQAVLYLLVPPLLYRAVPADFFRKITDIPYLSKAVALFTTPLFAAVLFNLAFSFYHMPVIFDAAMSDYALHHSLHFVLFIFSLCMWWSVFSPEGMANNLSELKKMGYMFLNGILLTPACALIIFSDQVNYSTFTGASKLLCLPFYSVVVDLPENGIKWLTPLQDQQLGGVVMKILQEIIYGCIWGLTFFQWYRKERDADEELEHALTEK